MDNDDDTDFASLIPGVKRLQHDRVNPYQHRGHKTLQPKPRVTEPATPSHHVPSAGAPAQGTRFNSGLQKKLQRRIRQGLIRPQATLDLHGCRQQQALGFLQSFLDDALAQNLRMLLIIHGQGYRSQQDAVLKPLVQRWLGEQPAVLAWCPAQPRDGAAGARFSWAQPLNDQPGDELEQLQFTIGSQF